MRATKQDEELTLLLTKLYTIQEQVGAKDPTSSSDKRSRAEQAGQQQQLQQSTMGRTRKSKKVGSRFLELKSSIVDHLRTVHTLMEAQKNSTKLNPKEVIAAQAEIREVIRMSSEEWNEINELYKNEARKKKSKFTPEELEVQQALVMQLKSEIDKVKEGQLAAHARGGMLGEQQNVQLNLSALAALDAVDFSTESGGGGGGGNGEMRFLVCSAYMTLYPASSLLHAQTQPMHSHFIFPTHPFPSLPPLIPFPFPSASSTTAIIIILIIFRHVQIMDNRWRRRHRPHHVTTTPTRTNPSSRCRIRYRAR